MENIVSDRTTAFRSGVLSRSPTRVNLFNESVLRGRTKAKEDATDAYQLGLYRSLRHYVHSRRSHEGREGVRKREIVFKHRARTVRTMRIRLAFARRGNANVSLAFENVVIQDYSTLVNYLADGSPPRRHSPSCVVLLATERSGSPRDKSFIFGSTLLGQEPEISPDDSKIRDDILSLTGLFSLSLSLSNIYVFLDFEEGGTLSLDNFNA